MTSILFFNDNMSSTNELITSSTADTKITAALVGFNAAAVSLWDSATVYAALSRVFRVGVVWETTAGVDAGLPAPDVNNVDWLKAGDSHWLKAYDNEFIYAVGDKVFFDHPTLGATFWELITTLNVSVNSDFASDTVWTKGTGWTIAAGIATKAAGTASDLNQATILTDTVRFKITYTISGYVAGTATVKCGSGTSGTARSANGTFTEELVCSGSTDLILSANSTADYDIDDFTAIPAGIDPDDDEVKWQMMLIDTQITFYNELSGYASGKTVYYGLGTAVQNGVYKSNAAAAAGEDPIDTSAKWDRQLMVTLDELTPTTTKGDILVENATVLARLAVGADGLVLTADAASAEGIKWSATVGTGDIVGPAASVDNRIAIFDSTTGKLLQDNTSVKVDDSDNMTGLASIETPSIVTVSNADIVLTPNGTGVIKMGQNLNTNNKDIISLASQNITFKPDTDGAFQVDYAGATTFGSALFRTTNSKRVDFEIRGNNSAVDLEVDGGAKLILTNLDTTDGNYSVIESRDKDQDTSSALVFENDSHASNQSTFRILTKNSTFNTGYLQDKDGNVTLPSQPAFFAHLSSTQNNVTGNAEVYTVPYDAEVYDIGGDFNTGTGIFTAPITGKYGFSCLIESTGLSAHTGWALQLVTSNRNYTLISIDPDGVDQSGFLALSAGTVLADMDSGDTAKITLTVSGGATVVDVSGSAAPVPKTNFSGYLVL